ncbi:hypothetical protein SAMN05444503_103433 [Pseudomonas sp. BS3767]|nr:hypothetical protein SAMN05444503_103433 [Pseudomonas sp. BS3767]
MLSRPASLLAFYTNGIYQRKISDDHLADIGLLKNTLRVCIRSIGPSTPARTAFSAILDTELARRNQLRLPVNNICHSKGLIQVPSSPVLRKTADAVLIMMKASPETPVSIGIRLRHKLAGGQSNLSREPPDPSRSGTIPYGSACACWHTRRRRRSSVSSSKSSATGVRRFCQIRKSFSEFP